MDLRRKDGPTDEITESDVLRIAARAVQLHAKRHPRPLHVTATQAAEMLGISRHTVAKIMRARQLRYNACGLIPIEEVDGLLAAAS